MRYPAAGVMLVWLVWVAVARGEDVTTLSGTTYRDVRVARVDPDGVTWEHATGVCKVDFNDLPEAVRRQYHYDPKQAAAFRDAQTKTRAQFAAQMQQARHEAEAGQVQRFQAREAAAGAAGRPGEFVYRRGAGEAAAQRSLGESIAAKKAADDFRTKDDGTIWDRRLWTVPRLIFGGNEFDGVAFNPKTDLNSHEYQNSLHHGVVSDVKDSASDAFFQPIYQTRSYYEEVERAEAFARGKP